MINKCRNLSKFKNKLLIKTHCQNSYLRMSVKKTKVNSQNKISFLRSLLMFKLHIQNKNKLKSNKMLIKNVIMKIIGFIFVSKLNSK